jgi:glycine cleavage system H protein
MDVFGTIEAVKAVSELFCPLDGEVVDINTALENDPALVNKDPYGDGWMIKLRPRRAADFGSLLSSDDYAQHIGE